MRAIVLNDVFHVVVIWTCVSVIIAYGHITQGTMGEIRDIATNASRMEFTR